MIVIADSFSAKPSPTKLTNEDEEQPSNVKTQVEVPLVSSQMSNVMKAEHSVASNGPL